ncbi:MAG: metallophosphoesterase [Bacteroidota bacterium]|nr:metallophosphoesterase [Bacteroidota bacterium]
MNGSTKILRKERDKIKRIVWTATRAALEASQSKYKRNGRKSKSHWSLFEKFLGVFKIFLKLFGYYEKGVSNAQNIEINKIDLYFKSLPLSFDGFTILHLSDLHIDSLPGQEDKIIEKISNLKYDICLLTGDYRKNTSGSFKSILKPLIKLTKAINPLYGKWAVLGNHDTYRMAEYEKGIGVNLLINETAEINNGTDKIHITGTDDPFSYFNEDEIFALEKSISGFKIAMVHTSELRDIAETNNYDLYLCGHTHGGQICLPNKKAIISHQFEGQRYIKGIWKYKEMTGYTNKGAGVSGLTVRFNCPPEIAIITLHPKS